MSVNILTMSVQKNSQWQEIRPSRRQVVMWGAGNQCRVDIPILKSLDLGIVAFIDQTPGIESPLSEVPLYPTVEAFAEAFSEEERRDLGSVIAIGNPYGAKRSEYGDVLKGIGVEPISFADSSAQVRSDARISEGAQIMPGAIIHNSANIGRQCIINTKALVEHDCQLMEGVEIGPGAVLTGRVIVGRFAWVGAGAVILPRLEIGENAIVGAGAVVTKNVPSNEVVIGSPARPIR